MLLEQLQWLHCALNAPPGPQIAKLRLRFLLSRLISTKMAEDGVPSAIALSYAIDGWTGVQSVQKKALTILHFSRQS